MLCVNRKIFPSSRLLFIHRDVDKVAKSVCRTTMVVPSAYIMFALGKLSGRFFKMALNLAGLHMKSDLCVRIENNLMIGVLVSAVVSSAYVDMRRRGFDIHAVRYEDLVARPLDMCRVILEYCRLPVSLVELAVKAFDADSQRNSPLARSIVKNFKEPEMTPEIKKKLNALLAKCELPLIGELGTIEGTLACS